MRTLFLLVLGFVVMGVLLEWTVTLVDPLKVRRLQDLRDLRDASIPSDDSAPWLLRSGEALVTGDGSCPISSTDGGEREGLSFDSGGERTIHIVGSAVAFGYGVRPEDSFATQLAGDLGAGVRVSAHPYRTRTDIARSLERLQGPAELVVVVDRLHLGLSKRFLSIRDANEERAFWSGAMPAVADVVALMTGDVRDEGGAEELQPIEPLLDALATRARTLGAKALFVDLSADPRHLDLCTQRGLGYVTFAEAGQDKPLELHPLLGFPDAYAHRALADRVSGVAKELLEAR